MKLEAMKLRKGYVVRPIGALGTVGWYPKPWTARFFPSLKAVQKVYPGITVTV